MRRRRLALLALVTLPVGVVWIACSVPSRPLEQDKSTCKYGCPEVDASIDGTGGAPDVISPDNRDAQAAVRNSRCGTSPLVDGGTLCTPDQGQDDPLCTGTGLSCQVVRSASVTATTACGATGQAQEGEACGGDVVTDAGVPASDCAPGLACVRPATNAPGQCQRYCCLDSTGCKPGYWCAQPPLLETVEAPFQQFVPVCIKGDGCTLLGSDQCVTPPGSTLTVGCVLTAPQTTACDTVGNNREGQDCPCAEGHLCITATNTCRKICHLGADSECPNGTCTGGGDVLPPGFGLCVGG